MTTTQESVVASIQLFDALSAPIEAALRASIQRFGVLVPVVKDQRNRILDGHHRSRIADDLGVPYRVDVREVESDDEAREIQRTLNADRRQLTEEQRREVVLALRQDGHSYRAIAGALGTCAMTVHKDVRTSGVNDCTPALPERVAGTDGKHYPARRNGSGQAVNKGREAMRERRERIVALAADGYDEDSIAATVGIGRKAVVNSLRELGRRTLSQRIGHRRHVDANRVMEGIVSETAPSDEAMAALEWGLLDRDCFEDWEHRLSDSIRALITLRNKLRKELAHGS